MTDFTAIRAASRSLRGVLMTAITNNTDPQLNSVQIDLRSPREMRDANAKGVSLWLFHVRRDADLFNSDAPRSAPGLLPRRPMPLELGYLVTPVVDDAELRQVLLGRVIETFNDHTPIRDGELVDSLLGTDERLYVHLDAGALPDPFRIWDALHMPYQTCVPYFVEHVTLESAHPAFSAPPVTRRETTYTQVVASGAS